MTKDKSKILDWRSTGRRNARRELFKNRVEYKCEYCGVTTKEPPADAPKWFEDIWPEERRELDYQLQANHKTKDLTDNTLEFIEWACQPCHKKVDSQTGLGESTIETGDFW
jgi:hypothetical protein